MASRAERVVDGADWAISKVIVLIFMVFFVCSIYAVYDSIRIEHASRAGDKIAEALDGLSVPERVKRLRALNEDVKAWLIVNDAGIDHPVMQAENNSYYLSHDYKRDYAISGSIYMDYRNDEDSDYSIYYGHNVNDETMLGRVNKFADKDYFMSHLKGELTFSSDAKKHNLTVIAYAVTSSTDPVIYALDTIIKGHNDEIVSGVKAMAANANPAEVPTKKLILLSTCTHNEGERAVLLLGYDD